MGWTAVCLDADLPERVVIAAHHGDTEIAVWRSATGQLAAWADRCPHRGMRLSHGFVRGEALNCIYHGWTYGADGGCTRIPAHPGLIPPATIRAQRFACVQARGLIWVGALGLQTLLPDLAGLIPVRSLVAEVSVDQLAHCFGPQDGPVWRGEHAGLPFGIYVQPLGGARCLVHLLVQDRQHCIAASRWIEGVRDSAERGATP